MKFLSNMIISVSVSVNIINAVFLLVEHLMTKYIHNWLNYAPTGAFWETVCESLYNNVILGIFGDELLAALFFAAITIAVLCLNLIPIVYNSIQKLKRKIVLSICSSMILIIEAVFLINLVIDMFMSI